MHKTYFAYICDTLAGTLSNCFVCQLSAVKLLKMAAHCANTDKDAFFIYWQQYR